MRLFTTLLIAIFLFSPATYAFELFPMVTFLSDQGSKSEYFYQVNNTSDKALPLEIFVKQRNISGAESELLSDSDDFFVFPPQVLILPGKTQMIKVKYIGEPVDISKSYRIVFSQLPINDNATKSSIKMLFQIGALAFVSANNVQNIASAKIIYQDRMPIKMQVTNQGSGVIVIPELSFSIISEHASYTWQWDDLKHLFDRQFLVPGEIVNVAMDTLLLPQDSAASVTIKVE